MQKATTLFAFSFFILLGFSPAGAQSVIQQDFQQYQQQALTEKIFVHTDKETYFTGETMWFSIYVVDGYFHRSLDVSKIAYVEVLDMDKRSILQAKIQLKNGRGSGSFIVPEEVTTKYTLRAYTRWMRNFGPDYFFEKELVIINSMQPNAVRSNEGVPNDQITVRFFPEGGQLVQNVNGRVALQATDNDGHGIDVRGCIRNGVGDTVTQFKTLKFGIGSFLFTPLPGVLYEAVVSFNGKLSHHTFPLVNSTGYGLKVNTLQNGKIQVVVSHVGIDGGDTVLLFIHTRNKIKFVQATVLKDGQGGFLIDRSKLDEGISHFTVFSGRGQPVCERLYFVKPKEQLKPVVKLDKSSFTKREKVTMSIAARTTDKTLADASLSVSVYKLDSTQFNSPMNIIHYLMLSSDLKGTIESPEYYFNSKDSVVTEATDNLMLTHGWSRFKWTDVLEHKTLPVPFSPEYEGMVISGDLMHRDSSAAEAVNAYLSFPGVNPRFFTAQSNSNGRFVFLVKNPEGKREAVIQAVQSPEEYIVIPHSSFSTEYSSRKTSSLLLSDNVKDAVLLNAIHNQAKNYFNRQTNPELPVSSDTVLFYGTGDKKYNLDDYQRFPTVEDVMREYVPEVSIVTRGKRSSLFVLNRRNEEYFTKDPLVLVDGIPITSTYRVTAMSSASVKTLDVVAQRYRLGPITFEGIVSLKTANGRLGGLEPEPGAYAFDFEGLQAEREFYSPIYTLSTQNLNRIPDFRNVLYWQPILEMSGSDEKKVDFYTSDETGSFVVVVQGLTSEGIAGSATFTFEVVVPKL